MVAMPFPVETHSNSMRRTVVINALSTVTHGATLLFTGAASQVCGGGMVLVLEVLNNIRLASNVFNLCSTTKWWCRYMAAPTYMVLKMNIMNKLKLYGI